MRDLGLYMHITLGILSIILSIIIIRKINSKAPIIKHLAALTAGINWLMLVFAGELYLIFYPATKLLVKAGAWPWAHSIIMETKEHWGILLPLIATVAAGLVITGKEKESKKWWMLLIAVSIIIAIMGRVVKMGASA